MTNKSNYTTNSGHTGRASANAADGFGNACDADLNNDRSVNFGDLTLLRGVWLTTSADADFNGDETVNFGDLTIFQSLWLQPPRPGAE